MDSTIYAPLELAQKLKKAGFDKHTFFYHFSSEEDYKVVHTFDVPKQDVLINARNNGYVALPAPTLGEIELPENIYIVKIGSYWRILHIEDEELNYSLWVELPDNNFYETELKARCMAWVYFYGKEVQSV